MSLNIFVARWQCHSNKGKSFLVEDNFFPNAKDNNVCTITIVICLNAILYVRVLAVATYVFNKYTESKLRM